MTFSKFRSEFHNSERSLGWKIWKWHIWCGISFYIQVLPLKSFSGVKNWKNWVFSLFFAIFHCFHHFSPFFAVFHRFSSFFTVFHRFSELFTIFHSFSLFFTIFHRFSPFFSCHCKVFLQCLQAYSIVSLKIPKILFRILIKNISNYAL